MSKSVWTSGFWKPLVHKNMSNFWNNIFHKFSIPKLVAMGSDGASVMLGKSQEYWHCLNNNSLH